MKITIKSKKKENSRVATLMKNGTVHSDSQANFADVLNMQFETQATFGGQVTFSWPTGPVDTKA